jgi:hypothetical protein
MIKLSETSALVMLWDNKSSHKSSYTLNYLSKLDLTGGARLYEKCNAIWPDYDQVIKNRKFGVYHLVKKFCDQINKGQIVIAASGFDALGIQIASEYRNFKIFEIDRENMEVKADLAKNPSNNLNNISFINADLAKPDLVIKELKSQGWDQEIPTLLVLEGISYYLSPENIRNLISFIKPKRVVFEFLKLDDEIEDKSLEIAKKVFGLIIDLCNLTRIFKYNISRIEELTDMKVTEIYDMKRLEMMRINSNQFFLKNNSGWIEIVVLE